MSDELICAVVPSETFTYTKAVVWDAAKREDVPIQSLVSSEEWWTLRRDPAAIAARFPNAVYVMRLPIDSVWRQPSEGELDLHRPRATAARAQHAAACRSSLASFLNAKLRRLDGMVRTGWWILAKARVRVSTFESKP